MRKRPTSGDLSHSDWQEYLNNAPQRFDVLLPRNQVVDQWFAQWAPQFAKVNDEFIKYVTGLAHPEDETEDLLSRWEPHFGREFGDQVVYICECDTGFLVQRATRCADRLEDWRLLTDVWGDIPVLCSSFASAARLVETFFPNAPPTLTWNDRDYL